MKIEATTERLRVDYRLAGKTYGVPTEGPQENTATSSTYPFDSEDVDVGSAFVLPTGAKLVRVVPYTATPASEDVGLPG